MTQRIVVLCAHSDDQVLGLGGTLARYAREGAEISVVVFSFGELTHPWLRKEFSAEMRVDESKRAGKTLGSRDLLFLGLKEGKFIEESEHKKLREKLLHLLHTKRPTKVFLHAPDDLHPDHRDTFTIGTQLIREARIETETYCFGVWNPIDLKTRDWPQLYVDVSDTFKLKMHALGEFRSQKVALSVLMLSVLVSAILNGIHHNCRLAERFYLVPP